MADVGLKEGAFSAMKSWRRCRPLVHGETVVVVVWTVARLKEEITLYKPSILLDVHT